MKKLFLSICLIFLPMTVFASAYFDLSVGKGGNADGTALGMNFGGTELIYDSIPLVFEFYGVSGSSDKLPSPLFDYPCPHSEYTMLDGERSDGGIFGMVLKTGYTFVLSDKGGEGFGNTYSSITLLAGFGFASQEKVKLSQSNASGWYYVQSRRNETHNDIYGSLLFKYNYMFVSAGYSTYRGTVIGIGIGI
jgi:hypothetical protein